MAMNLFIIPGVAKASVGINRAKVIMIRTTIFPMIYLLKGF
jgi:hypothetical protein